MTNKFFPSEKLTENDLFFLCYMIERVARRLHRPNDYVVQEMGRDALYRELSLASVLHSANPLQVEDDWIQEFSLKPGEYDVTQVDPSLGITIPTPVQMGKVYKRLILAELRPGEDWIQALIRVYAHPLCRVVDNYNTSAYFQPAPIIAEAFANGGF